MKTVFIAILTKVVFKISFWKTIGNNRCGVVVGPPFVFQFDGGRCGRAADDTSITKKFIKIKHNLWCNLHIGAKNLYFVDK
jgi:hypothetical protein